MLSEKAFNCRGYVWSTDRHRIIKKLPRTEVQDLFNIHIIKLISKVQFLRMLIFECYSHLIRYWCFWFPNLSNRWVWDSEAHFLTNLGPPLIICWIKSHEIIHITLPLFFVNYILLWAKMHHKSLFPHGKNWYEDMCAYMKPICSLSAHICCIYTAYMLIYISYMRIYTIYMPHVSPI